MGGDRGRFQPGDRPASCWAGDLKTLRAFWNRSRRRRRDGGFVDEEIRREAADFFVGFEKSRFLASLLLALGSRQRPSSAGVQLPAEDECFYASFFLGFRSSWPASCRGV